MGEYADMAIDAGSDQSWGSSRDVLYGLGRLGLKQSQTCKRCDKRGLYWHKTADGWRLHHWAIFGKMREPDFILHRCGFQADGSPSVPRPLAPVADTQSHDPKTEAGG